MKIACLTFHNSTNYGSVLQVYALQEVIKNMGHEYEIINYTNFEKRKYDSIFGRNKDLKWKNYLIKLTSAPYKIIKLLKFKNFSNKYLNVSSYKNTNLEELEANSFIYDFIICGSDQIWNLDMIRFDSSYFLSFVKESNKKIAYAASIGKTQLTDKEETFFKDNLLGFNKISVREKNAANTIFRIKKQKVELVLDPTLLLTPKKWFELAKFCKILPFKYILLYSVSLHPDVNKFIKKLMKKTGFKLVVIPHHFTDLINNKKIRIPSPLEFVSLFINATYVVTTSFHGTAFSCNLNKTFFTFIKGSRYSSTNSRIADLLDMLHLENRLYDSYNSNEIDLTPPSFEIANAVLSRFRESSIEFLNKCIV